MSTSKKLSLLSAIFINLNVMIGTGIFLNTYDLSAKAGAAGFLLYPLVGLCMLPLIAIMGKLVGYFPTGGLYAFGKSYSPFLGFFSCWSYFFGKLASCTVMLSVGATMLQKLIPGTGALDVTTICFVILAVFTFLNLQNTKVGIVVQSFFLTCKSIPIIFAIVAGVILFDTSAINYDQFIWSGMPVTIPLVLYCLAGFETACALGRHIENPSVNGPKAVYYSFGIIMGLYGLFQACIYMGSYPTISMISSYQEMFSSVASNLLSNQQIATKCSLLLSLAIGISALGGAYGILLANSWNLYTLAEHNHTFLPSIMTKLNQHQMAWVAVLAETLICSIFLLCNQHSLLSLRTTATLGIVIAYTVSSFAYYHLLQKNGGSRQEFMVARAAFVTCTFFVASCALDFFKTGIAPLLLFSIILILGSVMFFIKKN